MLTKENIDEFKEIYKQEFGEELSDEEARITALKVLNLVKAVLQKK